MPNEAKILMPRALTAENGAKGALTGEFKESIKLRCPDCDADWPDNDCEICHGYGSYSQPITISWTTIKEIYKRAVEFLGEEMHNGSCCVVERVKDKYLAPKIRLFLQEQVRQRLALDSKQPMPKRLRELAASMADVGHQMEWDAAGRNEWLAHSRELYGAAKIANEWASEIEREETEK